MLVFDNEDSLLQFKERCRNYGYEPLLDLIKNLWCDTISIMTDKKPVKTEKIIEKIYANTKCLPFIAKEKLKELPETIEKYSIIDIPLCSLGEKRPDGFQIEEYECDDFRIQFLNKDENKNKKEIIKNMQHMLTYDKKLEMIHKNLPKKEEEPYAEYLKRRDAYEDSEEAKEACKKVLDNIYFDETEERIKNAYAVISGMIWDTDGGILEYAIRNGFLPNEFGDFCVMSENVG